LYLKTSTKTKESLNNLLIIKGFICDPGAIQTHDLQNRNLTTNSAVSPINKGINF